MTNAKRKRNSEDDHDENDAPSCKRVSTANPYNAIRASYHSKSIQESAMSTPQKRSRRGVSHGAPKLGVQRHREKLPPHQTPTRKLNTASSTHEYTQITSSTNATGASTAAEPNPLFPTGLIGTTLHNGPQKRKRPSEEENAPSRPKKIARSDITGLPRPKKAPRPRVSCLRAPRLKTPRQRASRLENTGQHGTTNNSQHIRKLPTEIALQMFSYMEDKDVTKVRSTSKWFCINMSDRFAEYCTRRLEKKTGSKDKRWDFSLTRSSMEQLLFICRIPRLAHLITSVNINFDCPNQAGVKLFDNIERAYQNAAPVDRKSVLLGFNTLKFLPADELVRRFHQEKRLYEDDYRKHAMDAAAGNDLSMLLKVFKELTHLKNIRIGGWNKDMRVDYDDLMSAETRKSRAYFYRLSGRSISNTDEKLLLETHDECWQHVFKTTMAALSSSNLMLDSFTVDPAIHRRTFSSGFLPSNNMINSDCFRSLEGIFSSLKKLDLRLCCRVDWNESSALPYWELLQFAPELESVHIAWERPGYMLCERFNETFARYRSPRLRSIKLNDMRISGEALFEFLKGHKDSLRRIDLWDVTLVGGAWARIWALLKHELRLESAFLGWLQEKQQIGVLPTYVYFPWGPGADLSVFGRKRSLQLGPDDSESVDDRHAHKMAVVEREIVDGLDKLVRLSAVGSTWWG